MSQEHEMDFFKKERGATDWGRVREGVGEGGASMGERAKVRTRGTGRARVRDRTVTTVCGIPAGQTTAQSDSRQRTAGLLRGPLAWPAAQQRSPRSCWGQPSFFLSPRDLEASR